MDVEIRSPADQLRADAGVTVLPDFQPDPEAGISVQTLAAGDTAIATHVGPYETLAESYTWLKEQWLPTCGRVPAKGPVYEVYVDDPTTTPAEKLRTLIHLPLEAHREGQVEN